MSALQHFLMFLKVGKEQRNFVKPVKTNFPN